MDVMHKQTQLVCNSLLNRQPMKLLQSWLYVVAQRQVHDNSNRCIHHTL